MINIYEAQSANKRKSIVVLFLFFAFVTLATYILVKAFGYYYGYRFGGLGIFGIALIFSSLSSFLGYYFSDQIVLTISQARPADKRKNSTFFGVVENLSIAAGIPFPKLYVIEDSAPNAFATGRDISHATICATTGLLDKLDRTELEGVIAHELTHIKNYDTLLQTVVSVMVGLVALLGDWFLRSRFRVSRKSSSEKDNLGAVFVIVGIVFAIMSPIIAKLIQLAISRRREFMADGGSVAITKQPSGLISALTKISKDKEPLEVANKATAHLYIVNPFKEKGHGSIGWFSSLFNTHPPLNERIRELKKML